MRHDAGQSAGERSYGTRRVTRSIEVDADVEQVFDHWSRFEDLPRLMDGVRRTKQIGEHRILWDADIFGRQVVWEAEIVECAPHKRICWESRWGAPNAGHVTFEPLPGARTLLAVEVRYRPRGFLERLGARLGLVGRRIQGDLARFARFVETLPPDDAPGRAPQARSSVSQSPRINSSFCS